jgi:hypothetical protein
MSSMIGRQGLQGPSAYSSASPTGSMLQGAGSSSKVPRGYEQFQQFTPEQMKVFQQMFGNLGPDSFLSKLAGGDEETFGQMEAPALRQFGGLQGNLASRFSGMGGLGARKSSGFQNTASQASSDFASQLKSQRQNIQQQAIRDLMGMSESFLGQRPQGLVQKGPDWWETLLSSLGGLGGQFSGGYGSKVADKLF